MPKAIDIPAESGNILAGSLVAKMGAVSAVQNRRHSFWDSTRGCFSDEGLERQGSRMQLQPPDRPVARTQGIASEQGTITDNIMTLNPTNPPETAWKVSPRVPGRVHVEACTELQETA